MNRSAVLLGFALFVLATSGSFSYAQDRQAALDEFNALKKKAAALEYQVLAPSPLDQAAAAKDNAHAVRILPRDAYDNSFSSIRGGGAYYSFYFRIPDWGWGSDIGLSQGYISTGYTGLGAMADLGDVPLGEVAKETPAVIRLANFPRTKWREPNADFDAARENGLKAGDVNFVRGTKPLIGHTYFLRSVVYGYYDILVAFKILRQDADQSLVLAWKLVEQFDTQVREGPVTSSLGVSPLDSFVKHCKTDPGLRDVQISLSENVVTLRGTIEKGPLPHLVERAHRYGASKVINLLTIKQEN